MKRRILDVGLVGIALASQALACDKGNPPSAPAASKLNASSRHFSALDREGNQGSESEGDQSIRWDIISVDFATGTLSAGGMASADARDGSKITLTGSGTFRTGQEDDVTGGGTWETFDRAGTSTGKGTYRASGLVRFDLAPGTPPLPHDDIGPLANARAGLLVLRISYSDGSGGVLVVSCHLVGSPGTIVEGVTASKGFVGFLQELPPAPPGNANRTTFHVLNEEED
ncbi:MAG TPA: hypothetical protein VM716_00570 [Gemmatimonadales bacterium]|nr:hypothetical protein [Gemmatimonadales bacterium]